MCQRSTCSSVEEDKTDEVVTKPRKKYEKPKIAQLINSKHPKLHSLEKDITKRTTLLY